MSGLGVALAAGLVSAVAVGVLLHFARHLPLALPNARTLHRGPVPRVGGLAVWAGFAAGTAAVASDLPGGIAGWLPAWLALAAVSLYDDARGAPVLLRLAVQAVTALWVAAWLVRMPGSALPGVAPGSAWLLLMLVVAAIVAWSANLYNFMDGSDGLAGAMTLTGFGALACAAGSDVAMRTAGIAMAAATIPFLAANWPPARLFLGDVGAVPAGFLAAVLSLGGVLRGDWDGWFPLLVFLPFIADATATLVLRALRRERLWEAHRTHYYQRLNQLGAGHAGTLVVHGVSMLGTAATAVVCQAFAPQAGPTALLAWCALYAAFFAAIDYHWRKHPSLTR